MIRWSNTQQTRLPATAQKSLHICAVSPEPLLLECIHKVWNKDEEMTKLCTVVPTKSDSDIIFCLQLLSKILTCIVHLSQRELIDHLCINPILNQSLSIIRPR